MKQNLFTSTYKEYANAAVLDRLAMLDEIVQSDNFLIGLSNQASTNKSDLPFNVVNDLVLGFHLYCHQKKPRAHKGGFSTFEAEFSRLGDTANALSDYSGEYIKALDVTREVQLKSNIQGTVMSLVRSRAEELGFASSWPERPEFNLTRNDMNLDEMQEWLEIILYFHFKRLTEFAFCADFERDSLCSVMINQLRHGGLPCGWLSKEPYWDLSEWGATFSGERRDGPSIDEGVFADAREHLGMLYLD